MRPAFSGTVSLENAVYSDGSITISPSVSTVTAPATAHAPVAKPSEKYPAM